MAISKSALASLNMSMFDQQLDKIQTKFNYFYAMVRTMFDELSCDCTKALLGTIDKALQTIETDIKSVQSDFHLKIKNDMNKPQSSWSDYQQRMADIEEEKKDMLLQCLHVHNTRSAGLCKELTVLFPHETIVKDIFMRAREMLRHRFCTYTF